MSALTALGQSGPNKNGQVFQRADRAQDFQAISQALQSGDLAGAQAAFTSLEGTFGKQSQQAQAAASAYSAGATEIIISFVPPASTARTSAPPVLQTPPTEPPLVQAPSTTAGTSAAGLPEIVINLGGGSSGTSGAGLSVNATRGQNGRSEQSTINLNQQKNLELIVNLASYSAANQAQISVSSSLSVSA